MACPITSLPDCILGEIFLLALVPHPSASYIKQAPNGKAPWNIAAVNRSWRNISLSTRRLWTNIEVEDSHVCEPVNGMCVVQFPIIRCYRQLERSRSLPLNVDTSAVICECDQSVVRIAAAQCRRWEALTVHLDELEEEDFGKLFPNRVDLSSLKFLEYHCVSGDDYQVCLPFNCSSCQNISSMKIVNNHGIHSDLDLHGFPWTRLSDLHLDRFFGDLSDLVDLVTRCPNLRRLYVGSEGQSDGIDEDQAPEPNSVLMPHLELLEFHRDHSSADPVLTSVLHFLLTPKLRHLSVCNDKMETLDNLSELVSVSKCILTSLVIQFQERYNMIPLLEMMPELQELGLLRNESRYPTTVDSCDALLKCLIVEDQESHILLPALTRIRITQAKFDPALLALVVESRCSPKKLGKVATLSLVEIDYFSEMKEVKKIVDLYRGVLGTWLEDSDLVGSCEIVCDPKKFKNFSRRRLESRLK